MSVEKLQNAYYVTGDMERAVGFYRDALGLNLVFQDGAKWTQFKAGGVNFAMASDEGCRAYLSKKRIQNRIQHRIQNRIQNRCKCHSKILAMASGEGWLRLPGQIHFLWTK